MKCGGRIWKVLGRASKSQPGQKQMKHSCKIFLTSFLIQSQSRVRLVKHISCATWHVLKHSYSSGISRRNISPCTIGQWQWLWTEGYGRERVLRLFSPAMILTVAKPYLEACGVSFFLESLHLLHTLLSFTEKQNKKNPVVPSCIFRLFGLLFVFYSRSVYLQLSIQEAIRNVSCDSMPQLCITATPQYNRITNTKHFCSLKLPFYRSCHFSIKSSNVFQTCWYEMLLCHRVHMFLLSLLNNYTISLKFL